MPGPGAAFSLAGTGRTGASLSGAGFGGIEFARQARDRLAAYASPDGVTMPGAAWLVTAHAA